MSRLDYIILSLLDANNAKATITGMSIDEIADSIERTSANITIYKRVKSLLKLNYVAKGCKAGKAETFYVTDIGLKIKNEGEETI